MEKIGLQGLQQQASREAATVVSPGRKPGESSESKTKPRRGGSKPARTLFGDGFWREVSNQGTAHTFNSFSELLVSRSVPSLA